MRGVIFSIGIITAFLPLYAQDEGGGRSSNVNDYYADSKFFLCQSVSTDGKPIGSGSEFIVPEKGGFVYLLLTNNNKPLNTKQIIVDIYKDETLMETRMIDINPKENYIAFPYTFYKTALYSIRIYDEFHTWINSKEARIRIQTDTVPPDYSHSEIIFCESVSTNGTASGNYRSLQITPQGKIVHILFRNNGQNLQTSRIIVEVEKNDKLLEEKKWSINPNDSFTNLTYTFHSRGKYVFRFYNENNIWINTKEIKVTEQ